MNHRIAALIFVVLFLAWSPAQAYIGPGGGLTAVGAFLALVACLVVAFIGFLWYPLKRLRRKRQSSAPSSAERVGPPDPKP